ncbi:MAG: Eco57I restriction-modification methylase domain-containing protein [Candidatus Hodarchaeota archaeon]
MKSPGLISILDRFSRQVTEADIPKKGLLRFLGVFIFIKFLEAHGIEDDLLTPNNIQSLKEKSDNTSTISLVQSIFSRIDKKYYLGVVPSISDFLDSAEIAPIIKNLIHKINPIEFDVMKLSSFYSITEWLMNSFTTSSIEKKQKGQFFTPLQISQTIVDDVVDSVLEDYHDDLRNLKFIDPACGTGSFLISLYNRLNKEYTKRVNSNYNYNPVDDPFSNIVGIDICEDATFLTSLTLTLFRCILNKTYQKSKIHNTLKPGSVFKKFQIITGDALFLDWSKIISTGSKSFTAVIGNPPFVQYLNINEIYRKKLSTLTFQFRYQRWDLYILFIEKSIKNLKEGGFLSIIVPDSFLDEQYAKLLRVHLTEAFQIRKIIDLRGYKLFPKATIDTVIFHLVKSPPSNNIVFIGKPKANHLKNKLLKLEYFSFSQNYFKKLEGYRWRLIPSELWQLFDEINQYSFPLHEICYITNGFQISPLKSFERMIPETVNGIESRPFLKGDQIQPFYISPRPQSWFLYSKHKDFYLKLCREFSSDPKSWKPKFPELFENPKIVIPRVAGDSIRATLDNKGYYCWQTVVCVLPKHYIIDVPKKKLGKSSPLLNKEQIVKSKHYDPQFLLGVINSKITHFYFKKFLGNGIDVLKTNIEQFRIPFVTRSQQNKVISIVQKLEVLSQQFFEKYEDSDPIQTHKSILKLQNELNHEMFLLFKINTPYNLALFKNRK